MTGKIIVLTGGSGGFGAALKARLCADGNTVIDLSRSNSGEGNDLKADVSDYASVRTAFSHIKATYGHIDVLINNAGFGSFGATELIDPKVVTDIFDVNFHGAFYCIKEALPLMGRGGRIVNMSSVCAIFPLAFRTMYCASKAAMQMLSHSLREEVRPYGIQVTSVCPGSASTGFAKNRVREFATNERYGNRIQAADEHVSTEPRMTLEYATDKIYKCIQKRKYRPFYIVGGKYKLLYAMYRLLPLSVILRFSGGIFAKDDKTSKK